MNRRDRTAQQIESMWRDAMIIRSKAPAALDHIEDCLAGWPTQTVGADPNTAGRQLPNCRECNGNGCPQCDHLGLQLPDPQGEQHLTTPERLAGQRDRAHDDLTNIRHDINEAYNILRSVGRRIDAWSPASAAAGRNSEALVRASTDNDLCSNCATYGVPSLVGKGGHKGLCGFCYDFEKKRKVLPDRPVVRVHASGKYLSDRDIQAFMLRQRERDTKTPKKRKKGRAA